MHDGYASTSHSSPYLHSVTTPVQCTYIPVSDLRDVFGVYQWPIQLGGVLLAFAPAYQGVTPIVRTGYSVPLIGGIFSASGFCNRVLREKVISPQPNSKPGGPN